VGNAPKSNELGE
jgi:hypothetical protein